MKDFWKKDWFIGLAVALVLMLFASSSLLQSFERSAYDWGVRAASRVASDKIVVLAIDEPSIRNLGRWPWSREVHAKMADILSGAQAKVVANLVFFSEPQADPGLAYVRKLLELSERMPALANGEAGSVLKEAEQALNTDRKLAESYATAGNILLPMLFELAEPRDSLSTRR